PPLISPGPAPARPNSRKGSSVGESTETDGFPSSKRSTFPGTVATPARVAIHVSPEPYVWVGRAFNAAATQRLPVSRALHPCPATGTTPATQRVPTDRISGRYRWTVLMSSVDNTPLVCARMAPGRMHHVSWVSMG